MSCGDFLVLPIFGNVVCYITTNNTEGCMSKLGPYSGCSPIVSASDVARFHSKYEMVPESGCWIWTDSIGPEGYGSMSIKLPKQRPYRAHRVSYVIHKGVIAQDKVIDHVCRVRACVNPDHLRMVTQRENTTGVGNGGDVNRAKTCCPKCGSAYSANNRGWRYCKPCAKVNRQRRNAKKKLLTGILMPLMI